MTKLTAGIAQAREWAQQSSVEELVGRFGQDCSVEVFAKVVSEDVAGARAAVKRMLETRTCPSRRRQAWALLVRTPATLERLFKREALRALLAALVAASADDSDLSHSLACLTQRTSANVLGLLVSLGALDALVARAVAALRDLDVRRTNTGAHTNDAVGSGPAASLSSVLRGIDRALQSSVGAGRSSTEPLQSSVQQLRHGVEEFIARRSPEHQTLAQAARTLEATLTALETGRDGGPVLRCERCTSNPKTCFKCWGKGKKLCPPCKGAGQRAAQQPCRRCEARGPCPRCGGTGTYYKPDCGHCARLARAGAPPGEGVTLAQAPVAELSQLQTLWRERGGPGALLAAWTVHNPLRSWAFTRKRLQLRGLLGTDPSELEGFHGSAEGNLLSIASNGFDAAKRRGQVFGAGEYFAKSPAVSVGYCRDGDYMLVCRLCLGVGASDPELGNGDHIWVPDRKYYVIADPDQILPTYIVRFRKSNPDPCRELQQVLAPPRWSTLEAAKKRWAPPNRGCGMTAPHTDALWIGYLRPDVAHSVLKADLLRFLEANVPQAFGTGKGPQVHIVEGKFTQAKVRLPVPVSQELVRRLCSLPFTEDGEVRTVTVDDVYGSHGVRCTRAVAQYCRGRNLSFTYPCWCDHEPLKTERAGYDRVPLELGSAKGDEIVSKFMVSAPFHNGHPTVVGLYAIQNPTLQALHEQYRFYLQQKNDGEDPKVVELFHGTNRLILDDVYTHGLSPPSDRVPDDRCPRSGGKGLCTSLCDNRCKFCTAKHEWAKCHMFGLGIYLADLAQKSHRYVSQPELLSSAGCNAARRRYRMVLCSVLTGRTLQLRGHLSARDSMHNMASLRTCFPGDLEGMVQPVSGQQSALGLSASSIDQHDLLFVKGLGQQSQQGSSVVNSEYISFHPYQCLPRYEIVYEI